MTVSGAVKWGARCSLSLVIAGAAIAQSGYTRRPGNPDLQRHWNPAFDVALPKGVASDDETLKRRCWTQQALDSYVTEGRHWIEDIYGLPYGYVENHCLKEQLSSMNAALNTSYKALLRSLDPAERKRAIASERLWIRRRDRACNTRDGTHYVMLGSFVCLMNRTNDRLEWIKSRHFNR